MKYQSIAITDGSGRLGHYIIKRLGNGGRVTVLDQVAPKADVGFIHVSITDSDGLAAALKSVEADAVIHLAAIPNPRVASPQECFSVNTVGTWTILHAAEQVGVKRVVIASSNSATGLHHNPKNWSPQYLPVDEKHPIRPTDPYSLSKAVSEVIAKSFADRGLLEVLAIRPGHIVFQPEYPEIEARGADVNNYHYWSYVAPEDVAEAFALALDLEDGNFDCFFIGAADGYNQAPTLDLLTQRFGEAPHVRKQEIYDALPTASIFDTRHAKQKLGFEPKVNWRSLLNR